MEFLDKGFLLHHFWGERTTLLRSILATFGSAISPGPVTAFEPWLFQKLGRENLEIQNASGGTPLQDAQMYMIWGMFGKKVL